MKPEVYNRQTEWVAGTDMETGAMCILHTQKPSYLIKVNPTGIGDMLLKETFQPLDQAMSEFEINKAIEDAKHAAFLGTLFKCYFAEKDNIKT